MDFHRMAGMTKATSDETLGMVWIQDFCFEGFFYYLGDRVGFDRNGTNSICAVIDI